MKIMDATEADYKQLIDQVTPYKSQEKDFLVASILGKYESFDKRWLLMAKRFSSDTLVIESLVSGIAGREAYFYDKIQEIESPYLTELLKTVISNKESNALQSPELIEIPFDDDRTNGLKKFRTYCAACHGFDGAGLKNLAPSLKESALIDGKESVIASIILNGYSKENSDYKLMMPAYKEDKNLSNQDIVDLISYLKSTFTSDWSSLKVEEVEAIRIASMEATNQ
jgi:mono/diheme cytochrome c family protein